MTLGGEIEELVVPVATEDLHLSQKRSSGSQKLWRRQVPNGTSNAPRIRSVGVVRVAVLLSVGKTEEEEASAAQEAED